MLKRGDGIGRSLDEPCLELLLAASAAGRPRDSAGEMLLFEPVPCIPEDAMTRSSCDPRRWRGSSENLDKSSVCPSDARLSAFPLSPLILDDALRRFQWLESGPVLVLCVWNAGEGSAGPCDSPGCGR